MRDTRTAKYVVSVAISIDEQNQYGDVINDGRLNYRTEVTAKTLGELGTLLQKMEEVIK